MAEPATRSSRGKQSFWLAIISVTALLLIVVAIGLRLFDRTVRQVFLWDGMLTSVHAIREAVDEGLDLTMDDLPAYLTERVVAPSISHLYFDEEGRVVDPWNQPLHFEWGNSDTGVFASCVSKGPDRTLGTTDDIGFRVAGEKSENLLNGVWTAR